MQPSAARRNYTLAMLLLVYLFSLIDRQILAVLIEPIRADLHLTDTQMGMLSGLAFGLLYAGMGVPLARLADRSSRRTLIAVCLAAWSVATGLCGVAQSFVQLFLARVAVGTGEAGASPASQSVIADVFAPERRATALGIYSTGIFVGAGLGLALGGYLAERFGWRGAFVAVAVPGLAVALLFRLTVREPARGAAAAGAPPPVGEGFTVAIARFVRSGTRCYAAVGFGFSVFAVQSLLNWLPAFFARHHGLAPATAGARIGPIVAVAGTIGVVTGGLLADRLNRRDPRNSARMMALTSALVVPVAAFALLTADTTAMFAALGVTFFLTALVSGPTFALVQNLAPPSQRAFSAAMIGLVAVLLGNALGPFLTGATSDLLARAGVGEPLRWSLVLSVGLSLIGAFCYLAASRRLPVSSTEHEGPLP